MLSRFISKSSHLNRVLTLITSQSHLITPNLIISPNPLVSNPIHNFFPKTPHFCLFSTIGQNGNFGDDDSATSTTDLWKMSSDIDQDIDSVFSVDSENVDERNDAAKISDPFREGHGEGWKFGGAKMSENVDEQNESDPFREDHGEGWNSGDVGTNEDLLEKDEYQPWSFSEGKEGVEEDFFGVEEEREEIGFGGGVEEGIVATEKSEKQKLLEAEEKALTADLKGANRAFGDLIASSGITDEMLDSLIALKDFEGIKGLPPLSEIEDMRYERNTKKSGRGEIERQRLEELAKQRVRKVDEKGRAYGTGRRKCSIARVWIQPGEGKFIVNDQEFDVYFPMLDHRATLLRPFSETKTMGMWDVSSTVKGGGTSGQVGAIRLGISRALQNWEPGLRPPLKEAGFLTRDSRVVERKKPGKAKARKSFQWVKR